MRTASRQPVPTSPVTACGPARPGYRGGFYRQAAGRTSESPRSASRRSFAFTLSELLFVIALIVILMGIAWPALRMLREGSHLDTAVNAISTASQAIRALSTTPIPDLDLEIPAARYDGTALIIAQEYQKYDSSGNLVPHQPDNPFVPTENRCLPIDPATIHLTYNDQRATTNGSQYLESLPTPCNGFTDFPDRPPITLPPDIGVAGIVIPGRYAVATSLAVRFDRYGQLLVSDLTTDISNKNLPRLAFFDFDGDNYYNTSGSHPPREAVPAALGLVLYQVSQARNAGLLPETNSFVGSGKIPLLPLRRSIFGPGLLDDASGRLIFFDRYTGAVVKE